VRSCGVVTYGIWSACDPASDGRPSTASINAKVDFVILFNAPSTQFTGFGGSAEQAQALSHAPRTPVHGRCSEVAPLLPVQKPGIIFEWLKIN